MDPGTAAAAERRLRRVLEHLLLEPRGARRTTTATQDGISNGALSRSVCFEVDPNSDNINSNGVQEDVVFVPGDFAKKALISSRAEVKKTRKINYKITKKTSFMNLSSSAALLKGHFL